MSTTATVPDAPRTLPVVTVKPRRATPFYKRHPWVFSGAIANVNDDLEPGAEVALQTHDGSFIARGLWNPHSNIKVRLYTWNEDESLDREFWSRRLDEALAVRDVHSPLKKASDPLTNAFTSVENGPQQRVRPLFQRDVAGTARRLVFSEADGLSGLVVDQYDRWLSLQFTSLALGARRDLLLDLLEEKLQPAGVWQRTERGMRETEGLELQDGLLRGEEPPRPLFIEEHGVRYGVDVTQGQKTGFYLDQRENRAAAATYMHGRRVLDLFCYSGAFGLHAALTGAREVVGVDVSEPAIVLAQANAELNGVAEMFRFKKQKAFDALEEFKASGEKFDAVVLDPPKMARQRASLKKALRGYHSLNKLAVEVLNPGGVLVTCSCSGLVSREDFETMLSEASNVTGRPIRILESRGQPGDHPVSVHCPETRYLKCYVCHVG